MLEWLKKYKFHVLITVLVICACLIYLLLPDDQIDEVTENLAVTEAPNTDKDGIKEAKYIYIDIKGSVRSPGVYELPLDARVQDAVKIAGGLTDEADIAKLNLAEKLKDEMSIYVYRKGEQGLETNTTNSGQTNASTDGKVNLNTASASDLQQIPGIGESKATAIIEFREKEGLFQTMKDLQKVTGIGEKTVEKLKEYLDVK
ncbi:helix-hairpin-helix domain-containing protein [Listeria ivanovii]|uniref:helix-hairpin-helix domain-containing protein n=1 Tax=Listeria ivanovii TaxID=1638 RepID=UPI00190D38F4|nr:helix-hairpin-helix domain-containing protein [Listeria ivanovii]MBK3914418.1 ComEA family DNA-binding protein [Listeria ivanovii subsp. ivanovii]MBK3921683.1 ComEA family DNA-binding protein [Listeria ivanovii subsp. ivanovii]MBK3926847.1 ComEA family DNA-binding protein [Listeria ivanovii subsp. ivanovii]